MCPWEKIANCSVEAQVNLHQRRCFHHHTQMTSRNKGDLFGPRFHNVLYLILKALPRVPLPTLNAFLRKHSHNALFWVTVAWFRQCEFVSRKLVSGSFPVLVKAIIWEGRIFQIYTCRAACALTDLFVLFLNLLAFSPVALAFQLFTRELCLQIQDWVCVELREIDFL